MIEGVLTVKTGIYGITIIAQLLGKDFVQIFFIFGN